MRQLLVRILIFVTAVILLFSAIGSFLPRDFTVSTEIEINAPAEVVFQQVNELKNWQNWSSWNPRTIPELDIEFGSETAGKGASQTWTDLRGDGKLWITESQPHKKLEYKLEFGGFPEMTSQFKLVDSNGKTKVSWNSEGRMPPGPFYGFFGFLFESGLQHEYEKNLTDLKRVAEQEAKK